MDLNELRAKPHISSSAISGYQDCSLMYKFGRIDKIPREYVADALEFGTVIHKVLAEYYQTKMLGDKDKMPLKDIHDSFKKHWLRVAEGRTDIQYADGKDYNTYLIQGVDLLTAWHSKLPDDNFKVIGIEEAFSFEIPGIPVPMIGAIDLIEEDESGTIIITDFKTAGRSYGIDEIDGNDQLTAYQMAMKSVGFGEREILLRLDCIIKNKKPRFEQYYTTRSHIDELRLTRKIVKVYEAINSGVFIPNEKSWNHKNCPYRTVCDEWFLSDGGVR